MVWDTDRNNWLQAVYPELFDLLPFLCKIEACNHDPRDDKWWEVHQLDWSKSE